jgi:hypothetical protein
LRAHPVRPDWTRGEITGELLQETFERSRFEVQLRSEPDLVIVCRSAGKDLARTPDAAHGSGESTDREEREGA